MCTGFMFCASTAESRRCHNIGCWNIGTQVNISLADNDVNGNKMENRYVASCIFQNCHCHHCFRMLTLSSKCACFSYQDLIWRLSVDKMDIIGLVDRKKGYILTRMTPRELVKTQEAYHICLLNTLTESAQTVQSCVLSCFRNAYP
jgi:hypothetical protein